MARLVYFITLLSFLSTVSAAGEPRIIGGQDADREGFPHLVYLANDKGRLVCTGSLVSQRVVLTSSHCQWGTMTSAQIGRWDVTDPSEMFETRQISKTHVHPNWDSKSLTNDIVLLELDSPVEGIPVSRLHKGQLSLNEGQTVVAVGYGVGTDGKLQDKLQIVELEYVPNGPCKEFTGKMPGKDGEIFNIPYSSIITDDLMCTHFSDDIPKDFCHGDSGGPLLVKNSKWRVPLEAPPKAGIQQMPAYIKAARAVATTSDNEYTQIGIASWGFDCADPNAPGIGQRIGYAWDFIRTWICRIDGEKAPSEYSCGDFLEFHAYPDVGACNVSESGCQQRSDCNTDEGECCVSSSCSCKVPEGIEKFMCVPNSD